MGLFTRQRESRETDVSELEDMFVQARDQNDFFLIMIRAMFYFIKEFSLDLTEIGSEEFKQNIDALSRRITLEEKIKKLQDAFDDSKHLILSYIVKEKDYFQQRDSEFKNIIELLSEGMHHMNEENDAFNTKICESSANLERMSYLDDIRKIKNELSREIEQIRKNVKEKRYRDAQRLDALTREVADLRLGFERAKNASITDGLTGVFNRYAFDKQISKLVDRNMISPAAFSLLILDIDNFKQINDTHGHPVGDRVILAVAQQCKELVRKDDFLARYGGEEFALILPDASLRHGLRKARTICKTIAGSRYSVTMSQSSTTLSFSVSIGVSTFQPGDTVVSLVERADRALYEAKKLGKNRAVSEKRVTL